MQLKFPSFKEPRQDIIVHQVAIAVTNLSRVEHSEHLSLTVRMNTIRFHCVVNFFPTKIVKSLLRPGNARGGLTSALRRYVFIRTD